ncbi:MAG TPA: hypothetical protein VFG03_20245 [Telluria sp.]|nr:hypothetical protein [Telluria sp.]
MIMPLRANSTVFPSFENAASVSLAGPEIVPGANTADDVGAPNPWLGRSAVFVRPQELDDPVDPATGARPFLDSDRAQPESAR